MNKSICLRVMVTKEQNKAIEDLINLRGYKSKAQFARDSMLNHSVWIDKMLMSIKKDLEELKNGKWQ